MMSLRLRHAPGRGGPLDTADAELQSDVMRFMAILSLCLVAIFALVQSIPVTPRLPEQPRASAPPATVPVALRQPASTTVVPKPIAPVTLARQDRTFVPVTIPVAEPAQAEQAEPVPAEPQPVPVAASQQQGFTLQFEDDEALTRLISRDQVGFFAISADKSLRLKVAGGRMDFWPSSTPGQYHEMDGTTVPAEVMTALRRSGVEFSGEPLWGVTLPPATTAQIKQYLAASGGGRLVIGRNGDLRLEQ